MDITLQKQLFGLLEEQISAVGLETAPIPGSGGPQVGDGLRVLMGVTEQAVAALLELMVVRLSDDAHILQMYTTLPAPAGGIDNLREALPGANFYCPLGSFGIFDRTQLYHKHALVLREEGDADELCQDAMNTLLALYNVLDDYGGLLLAIANGRMTLQQAQQAGLLPAM